MCGDDYRVKEWAASTERCRIYYKSAEARQRAITLNPSNRRC